MSEYSKIKLIGAVTVSEFVQEVCGCNYEYRQVNLV